MRRRAARCCERHLVERLVLITALRAQLKTLVPRDQAVDEIDGHATLMVVREAELMLTAHA